MTKIKFHPLRRRILNFITQQQVVTIISFNCIVACAYAFVRPSAEYCGVFLRATKFDLEEKDGGTCHDFIGVPGCRPRCGRASQVIDAMIAKSFLN